VHRGDAAHVFGRDAELDSILVNVDRVNWLNVALMFVSLALALLAPFTLFLVAFAVLGPLHYLTEISWLHDRDFFSPRPAIRRWWLVVVLAAMAVVTIGYVNSEFLRRPFSPVLEVSLVGLAFIVAGTAVFAIYPISAVAITVIAAFVLAAIRETRGFAVAAYLLVTIVHVLLFTGCFMLFGAWKSGRRSGYASFSLFLVCTVLTVCVLPPHSLDATVPVNYAAFAQLNRVLLQLFGYGGSTLYSPVGRRIMQLIAFAYTYHYLNWFSKTSVIRWHQVPTRRAVGIGVSWIAAVALYSANYRIGFSVLYILSITHVLLEFPLNHATLAGLVGALGGRIACYARGGLTSRRSRQAAAVVARR